MKKSHVQEFEETRCNISTGCGDGFLVPLVGCFIALAVVFLVFGAK